MNISGGIGVNSQPENLLSDLSLDFTISDEGCQRYGGRSSKLVSSAEVTESLVGLHYESLLSTSKAVQNGRVFRKNRSPAQ